MTDETANNIAPPPIDKLPLSDPIPIKDAVIEEPAPPPKKVFTRNDIRNTVKCALTLPRIYPDYEPWEFEFRLALSVDAEDKRQDYLSLAPTKQTEKEHTQALDEVCDLLVSLPKGFGDLKDNGRGPGPSYREYVETAPAAMKEMLWKITEGAMNLYWRTIMPVEFRK